MKTIILNTSKIIPKLYYSGPYSVASDEALEEDLPKTMIFDTLQDRKENPKDYILTKDDKLINELLQ